jgi:hypothetical protein
MNKNFKISKVRRVLRLVDNDFNPATYFVYKVSGHRKLVKYFTLKKDATAWVKDVTTQKPMTAGELYNFYKGR